jgi:hypothetical protein
LPGRLPLFYAPLHYLLPMLVVLMTGREEGEARRQRLIATAIDCTASMVLAFVVVIWLAGDRLQVAMIVLLLSMATPYLRIWLHHRAAAA